MSQPHVTRASAPGKVILFGEHAVVYGRPAIAAPVSQVQARAVVQDAPAGTGIRILAEDLGRLHTVGNAVDEQTEPLELIVRVTLQRLGIAATDLQISIHSTIPIGSGMGSGAAVSAAIVQALTAHLGCPLLPPDVSQLVYQSEVLHHGTPSGIDNSVVSYAKPVYFVRGKALDILTVGQPFSIAIGDTGIFSPTKIAVADVRRAWEADRPRYEALFDTIGAIAQEARSAIECGDVARLGPLMDENQSLLRQLDVSSPELERLIAVAKEAGAAGAKLVGAGRGGNMIALVTAESGPQVAEAMLRAGAKRALLTEVR